MRTRFALLAIITGRDEIVPNAHSHNLHKAWKGPKQLQMIDAAGHNDVTAFPDCQRAMLQFLQAYAV